MGRSEQLDAILNGKWQPADDDRYALILDGDCRFTWVGGVTAGPETRLKYVDDKPQPSSGTWSVEGDQLVLRSGVSKARRFTRAGDTPKEHPARRARRGI